MSTETPASAPTQGLPHGTLVMITVAAILVSAVGIRFFGDVIAPILFAMVLAVVVHPVQTGLRRRGAPTWLATLAGIGTVYGIVVVFAWSLIAVGTHFAFVLGSYAPAIDRRLDELTARAVDLGMEPARLDAIIAQLDIGKVVGIAVDLLGGFAGVISSLFFLILLLFFVVSDASGFSDRLGELAGSRTAETARIFASGTRSYFAVSTVFGFIVAVIDALALWALGIDDPLLWGLLAFLTNYIPNVGFVIGLIPPTIIGWIDHGVGTALAVIAVYCIVNTVLQSVVQPKVVGKSVGISGTLSFLSLLVWGALLGGVGAIIAVPLTLFVKAAFIDTDPEQQWMSNLL